LSVIVESILYVGDNFQLVNTILDLSGTASAKPNYYIRHLSNVDDIQAALAKRSYTNLICELSLSRSLADKIGNDFPLLKTTYLTPPEMPQATELSAAMEGLVSDEVKETLDYLSIPIYFKNKNGRFLACNSYFSQLVGKTSAQVIGKTVTEALPAELIDEIEKIDKKVFSDQQVYFYECKIHDFAGRERDIVFRKERVGRDKIQIGMVFDVTEINEARSLLEKERIMLRTTADISPDLICFKDLESRYLGCNKAFENFVGYSEQEIVGKTDEQLFKQEQALLSLAQDQEVLTTKQIYTREEPRIYRNGEEHLIEVKKVPLLDKQGEVQGLIGIGRDITAFHLLQKRLKIADAVFENAKENFLVTDEMGNIIAANQACCAACGYSKSELLGSHISLFASTRRENIEAALSENKSWQGDIAYRIKNGATHFGWLEANVVKHSEEDIAAHIYSFVDLNQGKNVDDKIHFLSKHDPLTGIFNRIALFNRLEGAISRAIHNQLTMGMILVDINGFKAINDQYGHNAGDTVLQEIAARIKSCISEKDTVARFGDDEFGIIVDELANEHYVAVIAQNIADQFHRQFAVGNFSAHLSATIGIAIFPDDGTDADTLTGNAEKAMQRGKSDDKIAPYGDALPGHAQKRKRSKRSANATSYHFYSRRLTHHSRQQTRFEKELKQALLSDQFELYYQPQYDLNKRQVIAVEALLYWNHPQRGSLHSDRFSSLAEHSGLAVPIGLQMIRKAATQAVAWQKAEINFARIAINLTELQLSQLSLIADLQSILQETTCSRRSLEFEIDELIFKNDSAVIHENLLNLSKMGIALTIDKFAEERALFKLFERLKIDKFKLSNYFTEGVYADFINRAIQDGLLVMISSLGLTAVSDSLGNMTDGVSSISNKFSAEGNLRPNKAMKASEITFYLRCNKRK